MAADDTGLSIGWGSASITPDEPAQLQGQFYERVSEYVRDPVMATALAIEAEDGSGQAVIVSCDLPFIARTTLTAVREQLSSRTVLRMPRRPRWLRRRRLGPIRQSILP